MSQLLLTEAIYVAGCNEFCRGTRRAEFETVPLTADTYVVRHEMTTSAVASLSVAEAAELLGRHRTRIYALVRSGDLVAAPGTDGDEQSLRIDRSSVERWAVAGGSRGGPLTPRNAWAIIGLASGDEALAQHCLGLLERREEVSRARTRLAAQGLFQLAPRFRRRASLTVLHLPLAMVSRLEGDEQVVLTGSSVARPYGWHALRRGEPWALDVYLRPQALQILVDQAAAVADQADEADGMAVLLRIVEGDWPFPSHYQLAPQPLAALDLLDYSDPAARRLGREVLRSLAETPPTVVARRTARARATAGPLVGKLLRGARDRGTRLVSAPEVGAAVERHLGHPRPVPLSRAALEVLAIVAYKQPIARAGIERIRGTNSDSALDTLLVRELVALNEARLLRTSRAFLDFACLRDLADLPPLQDLATYDAIQATRAPSDVAKHSLAGVEDDPLGYHGPAAQTGTSNSTIV